MLREVGGLGRGEKGTSSRSEGFTFFELTLLLVLVGALLAGMILLVGGAVDSPEPVRGEQSLSKEGERLMGRIQALTGGARLEGDDTGTGQDARSRLSILVDVDGDERTGEYRVGQDKGLEKATILRPDIDSRRLLARVYTTRDKPPREAVLTDHLDRADPRAFLVGPPRRVAGGGVRLEIRLKLRSRAGSFSLRRDVVLR